MQLKVQVCPGGTAGLPCRAQYLPGLYRFTGTHIQVLQVRIKGLGAVRVQQLQADAIAVTASGSRGNSFPDSQHRRAFRTGKVHSLVEALFPGKGVLPGAVAVRHPPHGGLQRETDGSCRAAGCLRLYRKTHACQKGRARSTPPGCGSFPVFRSFSHGTFLPGSGSPYAGTHAKRPGGPSQTGSAGSWERY